MLHSTCFLHAGLYMAVGRQGTQVHCIRIVFTASQQPAYSMAGGVYSWAEQAACTKHVADAIHSMYN